MSIREKCMLVDFGRMLVSCIIYSPRAGKYITTHSNIHNYTHNTHNYRAGSTSLLHKARRNKVTLQILPADLCALLRPPRAADVAFLACLIDMTSSRGIFSVA